MPPSLLPESRGLVDHLGFSKNTGCQGDGEPQAEQGGLNDTVGSQFCELITAGSFQLPDFSYSWIYFIDPSKSFL